MKEIIVIRDRREIYQFSCNLKECRSVREFLERSVQEAEDLGQKPLTGDLRKELKDTYGKRILLMKDGLSWDMWLLQKEGIRYRVTSSKKETKYEAFLPCDEIRGKNHIGKFIRFLVDLRETLNGN